MDEDIDEKIITAYELNRINDTLKDDEVNEVLVNVTKIIANPNLSAKTATRLILQLEAISFSLKLKGKNYLLLDKDKPDANIKKNLYLSLSEATYSLVNALKYIAKTY